MNLRFLAVLLAVCLIQAEGSRQKLKSTLHKLSAQRSSSQKNGIHLLTGTFTSSSPLFCPGDEAKIKAAFDKEFKPTSAGAITATPLPAPFITAATALDNIINSVWILLQGVFNEAKGHVLYEFVEYNAYTDDSQLDMSTVKNADFGTLLDAAITASGITPATRAGLKAQFTDVFSGVKDQLNTLLIAAKNQRTASLMALTQRNKSHLRRTVTNIMDDVYEQYHSYLVTLISTLKSKTLAVRQILLSVAFSFETIVRTASSTADRNDAYVDFAQTIDSEFQSLRKEISQIQYWVNKATIMVLAQLERSVEKTIIDQVYTDIAAAVATATCAT